MIELVDPETGRTVKVLHGLTIAHGPYMTREAWEALHPAPQSYIAAWLRRRAARIAEALPALDPDLGAVAEHEEAVFPKHDALELVVGALAAGPLLDPFLDGPEGDHAGGGLDYVRGGPLHEAEASAFRKMELHAIPVGEGQGGHSDDLARLEARGAREGLGDDEGLLLDLARIGEVLEVAAPALAVDGAGRLDSMPARLEHLDQPRLREVALARRDRREDGLARQGEGHEDRLPLEEGEPVAASDELLDAQLDCRRLLHAPR